MKNLKDLAKEIENSPESKTFQDADSDQEAKALWENAINEEDQSN